jgi:Amt family ammonium transporter
MFCEWIATGKPTVLGIASGVVAGLVAITPAAGFVNLPASLIIGVGAGALGYFFVAVVKQKLGYDDSLDAFGVHGMCGIWGALATGLFANPAITEGAAGLFYGNPGQLWTQLISIVATAVFTAVGTLIVIFVTKVLDNALHGERGFEIA